MKSKKLKKINKILKLEFICIALILSVDKKFAKEKELYSNEIIIKDVLYRKWIRL